MRDSTRSASSRPGSFSRSRWILTAVSHFTEQGKQQAVPQPESKLRSDDKAVLLKFSLCCSTEGSQDQAPHSKTSPGTTRCSPPSQVLSRELGAYPGPLGQEFVGRGPGPPERVCAKCPYDIHATSALLRAPSLGGPRDQVRAPGEGCGLPCPRGWPTAPREPECSGRQRAGSSLCHHKGDQAQAGQDIP